MYGGMGLWDLRLALGVPDRPGRRACPECGAECSSNAATRYETGIPCFYAWCHSCSARMCFAGHRITSADKARGFHLNGDAETWFCTSTDRCARLFEIVREDFALLLEGGEDDLTKGVLWGWMDRSEKAREGSFTKCFSQQAFKVWFLGKQRVEAASRPVDPADGFPGVGGAA